MGLLGRVVRRALVRLARGAIRRRALVGVAFVIAAGAIAVSTLNLISLPSAPTRARSTNDEPVTYQGSDNEPSSTSSYMRGLQGGDARLMWNAYSDRAARDLQRRGASPDNTQKQLDEARQNGDRIREVRYVASYPIPNGSMHFYVLARGVGQARNDVAYVPYVFTLDTQGKIERID